MPHDLRALLVTASKLLLNATVSAAEQTAPEMFAYEEFPVNENKVCTDVHFPDAAFLVISCKTDRKAVKKE